MEPGLLSKPSWCRLNCLCIWQQIVATPNFPSHNFKINLDRRFQIPETLWAEEILRLETNFKSPVPLPCSDRNEHPKPPWRSQFSMQYILVLGHLSLTKAEWSFVHPPVTSPNHLHFYALNTQTRLPNNKPLIRITETSQTTAEISSWYFKTR